MNPQELEASRAVYQQQIQDTIVALHRLEGAIFFIDEQINKIKANNVEQVKE